MGDFKAIGTQFTQYYYSILDTDRTKLSTLYVRRGRAELRPPAPPALAIRRLRR
jgi:hypothetical protein